MKIIDSRITQFFDYYTVELRYENNWSWPERVFWRMSNRWWGLPSRFDSLEEARDWRDSEVARYEFVPQIIE